MSKTWFHALSIVSLVTFLTACGDSEKRIVTNSVDGRKGSLPEVKTDNPVPVKVSKYADLLKKFKLVSFDTLKVYYRYDDKRLDGKELTLKEAKIFPIGLAENYFGKLSGVYACCRFQIDSTTIGLIARTPSEYESSSVKLFLFDIKRDALSKEYFELSQDIGDAGDYYHRTSWLFKTKKNEIHSLVYDYSSYNNEVDDTSNHTIDEWRTYFVINCMSPKFDTLSKNEVQLKKRFKRLLKTED